MGSVKKFEDLIAWQKARILARSIYQITRHSEFSKDFDLRDQMRSTAVSMMSDIAQGFERSSLPDFYLFLAMAKTASAELRSQIYLAQDAKYLADQEARYLTFQADEVARLIDILQEAIKRQL